MTWENIRLSEIVFERWFDKASTVTEDVVRLGLHDCKPSRIWDAETRNPVNERAGEQVEKPRVRWISLFADHDTGNIHKQLDRELKEGIPVDNEICLGSHQCANP